MSDRLILSDPSRNVNIFYNSKQKLFTVSYSGNFLYFTKEGYYEYNNIIPFKNDTIFYNERDGWQIKRYYNGFEGQFEYTVLYEKVPSKVFYSRTATVNQ